MKNAKATYGLFLGIVSALCILPFAWGQGTQLTAPNPVALKVTRVLIQHAPVPGTDLETRMYRITFPPGAVGSVHHHPVVGLGYVLEGSFESAFQGDKPEIYHAGQSFQDKATVPHVLFRNRDKQKPLKFLMCYTVKKGTPVIVTP